VARAAALLLLVLGLLPVANWLTGGHDAPWYGDRLALWLPGTAILLGIAVVAGIVVNRRPELWREGAWQRFATRWRDGGWRADLAVALVALLGYVAVAHLVLAARPLLIDELIQVWQARVFAAGRLFLPAPVHPEFTAAMHLVDGAGRLYGQFPAGGPAHLALGALFRVEWLVGPVAGAVSVFLAGRLFRRVEPRPGTALATLLLYAFAPFVLFLSGSMMNHVTTLMWIMAAACATVLATRDDAPRTRWAWVAGLALGIAATIRPLDALAFALPTAVWLATRLRLGRAHLAPLLASGVGVAIPLAALLAINAAWTGDPFRFGYIELWGQTHALGFHDAPWGPPHTPARGLELINLYLLRLQGHLFETPVPGLLFATVALALTRRLSAFQRWCLAGSGLLLMAYFGYWHDGYYLGPRFVLPLAPWLAWWTARLPTVLRERGIAPPVERAVVVAGVAALAIGAAQLLPIRARQYHNGMLSMRLDPVATARAHGVSNATILVRESWGSQMVARLWGLGVSRADAEQVYRTTDACVLDEVIAEAERLGSRGDAVLARLAPHRVDSARLVTLTSSPDTTLRAMPGGNYVPRCVRRLLEDQAGFTLWPPVLLARDDNRWLRDLHARDSLVLEPGEPLWLLLKDTLPGSPLRLVPVDTDSMVAEWHMP
jgi:hypothetical protein